MKGLRKGGPLEVGTTKLRPIAVAGMHRAGTSMVAHALKLADVYFGDERDLFAPTQENPDGYWEHRRFVGLNDEILARLGGGWERPPAVPARFRDDDRLQGLEVEAKRLVREFRGHESWAWKDPRNSLTFGLWNRVVPDLTSVVCLRNPLEVALSLRRRGMFSYGVALELWETYYRRLLESAPEDRRLVTHYESYFSRPRAELRRLFDCAGVAATRPRISLAAAAINRHLRHSAFTVGDLLDAEVAPEIVELYLELRREAGLRGSKRPRPARAPEGDTRRGRVVDVQKLEVTELRQYVKVLESIVAVRELELRYTRDGFDAERRTWEMKQAQMQERLRSQGRELAKRSRELHRLAATKDDNAATAKRSNQISEERLSALLDAHERLLAEISEVSARLGEHVRQLLEPPAPDAPLPPRRARQLRTLLQGHRLLPLRPRAEEMEARAEQIGRPRAAAAANQRALICSYGPPPYDRDSGARRLWQLIGFLRDAGWDLTFLASSPVEEDRYAHDLLGLGIPVYDGSAVQPEEVIASGRFDLALCAYWQVAEFYLPLLREVSPQTAVIIDSVDLHFVREARRAFAQPDHLLLDQTFGGETTAELNVYAAADAVLAVSPRETELLAGLLCEREATFWIPDAEDLVESAVPLRDRAGILFVGGFRHLPNVDALEYFCTDVVPLLDRALLRRHPITVVGDGLDERAPAAARRLQSVQLVGWAPSLEPYLDRARVSVVPLRYGAGTKRKVLQSLLVGTPVVTTSIGAEGLNVRSEEHVLVADDAQSFAEATTRLLQDDHLWRRLSTGGRQQVAADHASDAVRRRLLAAVESTLKKPRKPPLLEAGGRGLYEYRTRVQAYQKIVPELREALRDLEPVDGIVLVFSEGVGELLQLGEREAHHFPPIEVDGAGARPTPAGSAVALDRLRGEIAAGAAFLVVPKWTLGSLRSYPDVLEHLQSCEAQELAHCVVYRLGATEEAVPATTEAAAAATNGAAESPSHLLAAVDA